MKINFTRPTIYMSHSISGDNGDIAGNCQRAQAVVRRLRRVYPEVKWYCPGEVNLAIDLLWQHFKYINTDQVLEVDCEILRNCHAWFWDFTTSSKGCNVELECVGKMGWFPDGDFPIIETDLLKANFSEIRRLMNPIVETAKARFRDE